MPSYGTAVTRMLDGLVNVGDLLPYTGDWIPEDHRDRLRQYEVFRALAENRFGRMLKDRELSRKLREYGDYALIVETSRDAVLGDRVDIEVPGANAADNPGAANRKELLSQWAERERWASKVTRGETDAAVVGDCVYELRSAGTRLRLRAHDPESFFPVWENSEGDFSEAYLAWEEVNNGQYIPNFAGSLKDLRDRDGEVVLYRRHYRQASPADAAALGITAGEREMVCVVTAAWYQLEKADQAATGWDRYKLLGYERTADNEPIQDRDTGFEEVPLFYVPNVESNRQPWGLPEGHAVLQVLLDAAQDHTDLKENTYMNAFPVMYDENQPIAAPAAPRPGQAVVSATEKYKPGTIYNGRKLGVVDLSQANKVLLEHEGWLIDKALANSRTSAILAGIMDGGQFPSGYAMMIAMLPTFAKTLPKRQTRKDKLGMLLKHVLRWYRDWGDATEFFPGAGGEDAWPAGMFDDTTAYPSFGSIVPIDKKQVSEIVRDLLGAQAISEETAVAMLVGSGFPIDDAAEEVQRLRDASQPAPGFPGSGMGTGGLRIPGIDDEQRAA